ncbi:MAG TPA: hypothetical protein VGG26_09015 [Terracidiphilus sp.]|jgi:hypothetical protein
MDSPRIIVPSELQRRVHALRRESDALIVFVIRTDDVAFSADLDLAPRDAGAMIDNELPRLVEALAEQRRKKV